VQGQASDRDDATVGVKEVEGNVDSVVKDQVIVDIKALGCGLSQCRASVLGLVVEGSVEAELVLEVLDLLVGTGRSNKTKKKKKKKKKMTRLALIVGVIRMRFFFFFTAQKF
jgi:hypothetical protein